MGKYHAKPFMGDLLDLRRGGIERFEIAARDPNQTTMLSELQENGAREIYLCLVWCCFEKKSVSGMDAVKTLITTPKMQDRTRRAIEYLTTGLWHYQSFGMDYPTTDPEAVSELMELTNTLRNDMSEQEAKEVGFVIPS